MTSLKLYLLVGPALLSAAVTQMDSTTGEDFAWFSVLSAVLGLMQPYVSRPKNVKLASGLAFAAAAIAVASEYEVAEMIGGGLVLLVLLACFGGVLRYRDPSPAP